ncbi:hypothetical protein [Streptomyces flaveolus]|uniref:hypothetical protein n=1 Tax=Streptomyces flaveolus TaxID=67297 RepID=UPI0036FF74F8
MTDRYRVTVTVGGRPMLHGWWSAEAVARAKFSSWVGEHGDQPGARVTLTDEANGSVLTEWPDPG